jgi:iron complex outermembrane receptor protein
MRSMLPASHRFRRSLLRALAVAAGMVSGLAAGAPPSSLDTTLAIELPAQPLGEALRGLAKQANLQILFEAGLVTGYPAPAIRARVSPRDALNMLLGDTGLEAYEQAPGVIVIRRRDGERRANDAHAMDILHRTDPSSED